MLEEQSARNFNELAQEVQDTIVNKTTGITREKAEKYSRTVLHILSWKTGAKFSDLSKKVKKRNKGPSNVDVEIMSANDITAESDALVTTVANKKHYKYIQGLADTVTMYSSSKDAVTLAIKHLPHPPDDIKQQRRNFRGTKIETTLKN